MTRKSPAWNRRGVALAASCLVFSSSAAWANGFRNPPPGASALALDGAKSAMITDVTGQGVNPALLDGLDAPAAAASVTLIHGKTTFTSAMGPRASTRNNLKTLPDIFAAYPINEHASFGLGVTTPYGQSIEWPRESGLPYFTEMRLVNISPALAVRVSDMLSVGVGLDIYVSDFATRQMLPWADITGNPMLPPGTARLEADGNAVGATAGLLARLTASQRLSLVYRAPFSIDYKGDADLSLIPTGMLPPGSENSRFRTEIDFPTVVVAGYAVDVTPALTLGVEVEWIEFSRFENLPVQIGDPNVAWIFPGAIPQQWKDTWTYGAAARWQCSECIQLRLSYRFMESPIPDATLAPTLPDADKHAIGIGIGWKSDRAQLDLAYAYSVIDDRTVGMDVNPALAGKYEMDSHIVAATAGFAF